jgi:hypothetical protein
VPVAWEELSLVIVKSLEKDPERRYGNMELFAEDLDCILEGREPLAQLAAKASVNHKGKAPLLQPMRSLLVNLMPTRQHRTNDPHVAALDPLAAVPRGGVKPPRRPVSKPEVIVDKNDKAPLN